MTIFYILCPYHILSHFFLSIYPPITLIRVVSDSFFWLGAFMGFSWCIGQQLCYYFLEGFSKFMGIVVLYGFIVVDEFFKQRDGEACFYFLINLCPACYLALILTHSSLPYFYYEILITGGSFYQYYFVISFFTLICPPVCTCSCIFLPCTITL